MAAIHHLLHDMDGITEQIEQLKAEHREKYPGFDIDSFFVDRNAEPTPSDSPSMEHALQFKLLAIREKFWSKILGAEDPRRAFGLWLRHLDELCDGRYLCSRFHCQILGEIEKKDINKLKADFTI